MDYIKLTTDDEGGEGHENVTGSYGEIGKFCRDITKIGSNKRPSLSPPPFQLINDVGPEKVSQNSLAATWVKKNYRISRNNFSLRLVAFHRY